MKQVISVEEIGFAFHVVVASCLVPAVGTVNVTWNYFSPCGNYTECRNATYAPSALPSGYPTIAPFEYNPCPEGQNYVDTGNNAECQSAEAGPLTFNVVSGMRGELP